MIGTPVDYRAENCCLMPYNVHNKAESLKRDRYERARTRAQDLQVYAIPLANGLSLYSPQFLKIETWLRLCRRRS